MSRAAIPLPDPPLRDEATGVVLRPWGRPGDADALVAAWADPDVGRWTAVPDDRSLASARRWLAGEATRRNRGVAIDLAVVEPADADRVSGEVGLSIVDVDRGWAEIGFWTAPSSRGTGRATASVLLLTDWALDALPLTKLFARVSVENGVSGRVVQGAGYTLAGEATAGTVSVWVRGADGRRSGGTVDL